MSGSSSLEKLILATEYILNGGSDILREDSILCQEKCNSFKENSLLHQFADICSHMNQVVPVRSLKKEAKAKICHKQCLTTTNQQRKRTYDEWANTSCGRMHLKKHKRTQNVLANMTKKTRTFKHPAAHGILMEHSYAKALPT